jgi:hypothetical protein
MLHLPGFGFFEGLFKLGAAAISLIPPLVAWAAIKKKSLLNQFSPHSAPLSHLASIGFYKCVKLSSSVSMIA